MSSASTVTVTLKVKINRDAWAEEYGTEDPEQGPAENMRATHDDVQRYFRNAIHESAAGQSGLIVSVD